MHCIPRGFLNAVKFKRQKLGATRSTITQNGKYFFSSATTITSEEAQLESDASTRKLNYDLCGLLVACFLLPP